MMVHVGVVVNLVAGQIGLGLYNSALPLSARGIGLGCEVGFMSAGFSDGLSFTRRWPWLASMLLRMR